MLTEQARRLESSAKLLESYSYKNVLDRGFAVIRDGDGKLVSAADAQTGATWSVEFKDGKTDVVVGHGTAKPKTKGGKDDTRQGSLL